MCHIHSNECFLCDDVTFVLCPYMTLCTVTRMPW